MHSTTYLTTHSTMHSVTHSNTHSTTHSTTDPSQIAARSVSFVLSSFTFFFRVSLFYTCCFFCVILLCASTFCRGHVAFPLCFPQAISFVCLRSRFGASSYESTVCLLAVLFGIHLRFVRFQLIILFQYVFLVFFSRVLGLFVVLVAFMAMVWDWPPPARRQSCCKPDCNALHAYSA